jgi:hypothetical protein
MAPSTLTTLRRLLLHTRWAVFLVFLAGCSTGDRFADGLDDPTGPRLDRYALKEWRPPDAAVFDVGDEPAIRVKPRVAQAPQADKARIRVPAVWLPPGRERPWRWIVVHHSATASGGARDFDRMHRGRGWDELGYHFVIGNGTDTPDGAIEVGPRWLKQKQGAHAKTDDNRFNELGVGICLVGDFDHARPTPKQLRSLAILTAFLMDRYNVAPNRIIGHGDTKATACPGTNLQARLPQVRAAARQAVAQGLIGPPVHASGR